MIIFLQLHNFYTSSQSIKLGCLWLLSNVLLLSLYKDPRLSKTQMYKNQPHMYKKKLSSLQLLDGWTGVLWAFITLRPFIEIRCRSIWFNSLFSAYRNDKNIPVCQIAWIKAIQKSCLLICISSIVGEVDAHMDSKMLASEASILVSMCDMVEKSLQNAPYFCCAKTAWEVSAILRP